MKLSDFDFRVWSNDENKFINKNCSVNFLFDEKYEMEDWVKLIEYTYDDAEERCIGVSPSLYENDDVEIELFTGLYDKNGNKVYEGDILHYSNCHTNYEVYAFKVVFIEGTFNLVEFHDGSECYQDIMADFLSTELEVVGNIHENEDLLKGK